MSAYVTCIRTGLYVNGEPERKTLCGKPDYGFAFLDAGHWLTNAFSQGRLLGCPACLAVIGKHIEREINETKP